MMPLTVEGHNASVSFDGENLTVIRGGIPQQYPWRAVSGIEIINPSPEHEGVLVVLGLFFISAMISSIDNSGSSASNSSPSSSTPSPSASASSSSPTKKARELTGIEVSYAGSMADGTQIDDQNSGILVRAKYDDGSSEKVTGWKVQNPGAINYNGETAFVIEYEGQTAELKLTADPPTEYKNALVQANQYSSMMHMSKKGIYDQLMSEYGEQFPADAAQWAVDHMHADWNANALETAKRYRDQLHMSTEAIRDQLTSPYGEQFTQDEANYAIEHLND